MRLVTKIAKGSIISLIELYRFISICLTVAIYMVHGVLEHYSVSVMLFFAFCVAASAFLLNYLYKISYTIRPRLHLLLLIEISGISFIIVFTGGLDSPFIWCFLNPLLIISYYMFPKQKVIYLVSNFVLLCALGYYVERTSEVRGYLLSNSNIILSFILLLILINIVFEYNRQIIKNQQELRVANENLESYNARIKGMTRDMLFMYEAVQTVSSRKDNLGIVNIILDFAGRVSPECNAFFVLEAGGRDGGLISSRSIGGDIKAVLMDRIRSIHPDVSEKKYVAAYTLETGVTAAFIRVSNIRNYGTIGLLIPGEEYSRNRAEYEANLLLISQLGATFFEKIEAEVIGYELAVADEQNRIADNIHDSVIQRLFALSCFSYDTVKNWEQISDKTKREQMTLIMETIQSSLRDLRSTIYNLSNKKQQIELFKESVYAYLADMEKLSGVKISPDITGDPDSLTLSARKALYRIITECTGNAVRHAKCRNIWASLHIGDERTALSIRDDGIGLDLEKAEQEKNGLGLYNIKSLIRIYNGSVEITTEKGSGTTFDIRFMNSDIMKKIDEE